MVLGGEVVSALSNHIEQFILSMMAEGATDLQRNELAAYFRCAPSQINYVLSTRFSPERGFVVESRRGGGGYVRIVRLAIDGQDFLREMLQRIGDELSARDAAHLLDSLVSVGLVTKREAAIMHSGMEGAKIPLPAQMKDAQRAQVLRAMIWQLCHQGGDAT